MSSDIAPSLRVRTILHFHDMLTTITTLMAIAGYLTATWLTYGQLNNDPHLGPRPSASVAWAIGLAIVCHASAVFPGINNLTALNLALGSTISIVALAIVALFLLSAVRQPILALGFLVLPVAAAAVAIGSIFPGDPHPLRLTSGLALAHSLIAALAYAFLSLAVTQAMLVRVQERSLRQKHSLGMIRSLPPVETLETLLFQLITVGFVLLSITLLSGISFSNQLFGKAFVFNHHAVLSLLAWCSFATLLGGRVFAGWRGQFAVQWTLASFILLLLAYFGTRFVLEVLLAQP